MNNSDSCQFEGKKIIWIKDQCLDSADTICKKVKIITKKKI